MYQGQRNVPQNRNRTDHHRYPVYFSIELFALCALLILLAACGTAQTTAADLTPTASPIAQGQVHVVAIPTLSRTVLTAQRHLYIFASSNVGLMQPVVDSQGNVWVGEMNANRLGRFNASTGAVTSWSLPSGRYGIMATLLDAHGNVWFSEQFANYIGRFDPRTQTFKTFPLGTWNGGALGPQNLQFDVYGLLWFTASDGHALGRLDPSTGAVHIWSLPVAPSGMVVAPNGLVWFGYLTGGGFGNLNPLTGQITVYPIAKTQAQVYAMTIDTAGRLWFTEASPGRLDMFDPSTGNLTEFPVPSIAGRSSSLSELIIAQNGDIWFVDVGTNMLVRYKPGTLIFTFFRLSLGAASPFALTLASDGKLWFTAGNAAVNYLSEMAS
jgi:virginiamycin B lyase